MVSLAVLQLMEVIADIGSLKDNLGDNSILKGNYNLHSSLVLHNSFVRDSRILHTITNIDNIVKDYNQDTFKHLLQEEALEACIKDATVQVQLKFVVEEALLVIPIYKIYKNFKLQFKFTESIRKLVVIVPIALRPYRSFCLLHLQYQQYSRQKQVSHLAFRFQNFKLD